MHGQQNVKKQSLGYFQRQNIKYNELTETEPQTFTFCSDLVPCISLTEMYASLISCIPDVYSSISTSFT